MRSSAGRHADDTSSLCTGKATASRPYSMAVATQIVTPQKAAFITMRMRRWFG